MNEVRHCHQLQVADWYNSIDSGEQENFEKIDPMLSKKLSVLAGLLNNSPTFRGRSLSANSNTEQLQEDSEVSGVANAQLAGSKTKKGAKASPLTYDDSLPVELTTLQLRMIASLPVGDRDLVKLSVLMHLLDEGEAEYLALGFWGRIDFDYKKLGEFEPQRVDATLRYYGIDPQSPNALRMKEYGGVSTLIRFICNEKEEGLFYEQAWPILGVILREFLQEKGSELTPESKEFVEKALRECLRANTQVYDYIVDLEQLDWSIANVKEDATPLLLDFKAAYDNLLSEMLDQQVERINREVDPIVGNLVSAGWPGHAVGIEVRKVSEGYEIVVGNGGGGNLKFHDQESWYFGWFPTGLSRNVNLYLAPDEGTLREILKEVTRLAIDPSSGGNRETQAGYAEKFYGFFDGCTKMDGSHIPYRQGQETVGNCAVRGTEEVLFHALQRADNVALANQLNAFIAEYAEGAAKYDAMKDSVDKLIAAMNSGDMKQPLEPFFPVA
jgi:hypothetical protein